MAQVCGPWVSRLLASSRMLACLLIALLIIIALPQVSW